MHLFSYFTKTVHMEKEQKSKTLSDEQLIAYNRQGLIPGPDETEEEFLRRAQYCLNIGEELASSELPFDKSDQASPHLFEEAFATTSSLFDISPKWIPIFFSNHHLAPWHGGCAWIFQLTEASPTAALFQLREAFRSKNRYLGVYQRDELVAHELVHVGRMMFHEPKFEEFHACRTANSFLRRWLGPIIQSAKESLLFVAALLVVFLLDIFLVASGQHEAYLSVMWVKSIPLALILMALSRLVWRHRQFSRCWKNLSTLLGDLHKAGAVIYRLSDSEIIRFSRMTPSAISQEVAQQQKGSLRWRLLSLAYFV